MLACVCAGSRPRRRPAQSVCRPVASGGTADDGRAADGIAGVVLGVGQQRAHWMRVRVRVRVRAYVRACVRISTRERPSRHVRACVSARLRVFVPARACALHAYACVCVRLRLCVCARACA